MTNIKLTYINNTPVAEIWNGTWTAQKDIVWFKNVEEARACTKRTSYDLLWDCL